MPEHKNDQDIQEFLDNSVQILAQYKTDPSLIKADIIVPETEDGDEKGDIVITDQRRPQFRFSENYRRRNY